MTFVLKIVRLKTVLGAAFFCILAIIAALALVGTQSLSAAEPAAQKSAATVDPSDLPPDDPGDVEYVSKCFPGGLTQTDGAGNQVKLGLATTLYLNADKLVGNKQLQQAISRLHFIQHLGSSGKTGDDLLLAAMAAWPTENLKSVDLLAGVNDEALANLERFRGLEDIEISSERTTDAAFRHVGTLANLKRIAICSPRPKDPHGRLKITGSGLNELSRLKKLRKLDLLDCPVDDAGMRNLKGLNLTRLALRHPAITDRGIEAISDMTSLEDLALVDTAITDKAFIHLAKLQNLRSFGIEGDPNINGSGLNEISALKNLYLLCLIACPVDDAAVKNLKGMKLTVLHLCLTQITDGALDDIKDMTALEQLYVGGTKVTKAAITRLKGARSLTIDDRPVDRKQLGLEEEKK